MWWLLWFVMIGALAGWIAGRFMNGYGFGLVGDVVVGIAGSFVGAYLFRSTGAELGAGLFGGMIVALLFLYVARLFTGRRSGRKVWS